MLFLLLVPCSVHADEEPVFQVVVQDGDTLTDISTQYLKHPHQWKDIAAFNHLKNPNLIYPGQIVNIPFSFLRGDPANGSVNFIKGRVDIQLTKDSGWKSLALHDTVPEGSWIKTGENSAVEILFPGNNSYLQHANTHSGLSVARRLPDDSLLFKLSLGIGKTITRLQEATGRNMRFEIDTPSSICSARGTVFRTTLDRKETTISEVLQGDIDVEAAQQKVTVREGEGTLVQKGQPPMEPRKLLMPPPFIDLKPVYTMFPLHFSLGSVQGAVSYRAVLARDQDFKDIAEERVLVPGEEFIVHYADDGTYYLQTASIDVIGLTGIPSEASKIQVRVNPFPPMIESPVDGNVYEESPAFKWLKVEDALAYHVQIGEDSRFTSLKEEDSDIRDLFYEPAGLEFRTYYFRIRSIGRDNYQGEWSDVIRFTLSPPSPAQREQ